MNTLRIVWRRILMNEYTKEEKKEIIALFLAWVLNFIAFMLYVHYWMIH